MAVNFPDSPANGDSFSVNDTTYVYNATAGYWDITSTVQASASTSTNAPSNPSTGDFWFDPSALTTYIYYSDGSSSQWVPANSVGARGAPGPGYPTAYYSVDYTSTATGNVVFNSSSSPTLPSYTVGKVNAWVNGVLRSDINASDGSNVEISLSTGDEVQIINFGDTDVLDPTASSNDHTTYTTLSSLIDTVQSNVTSAGSGVAVYATPDLLPLSGNDAGEQAYVNSTNRLYINNGTGWYSIGLVNNSPNITSVQDASTGTTPFTLTTDGTATVITITASDPEQIPLIYNYSVTSGSLTNGGGTTATVVQGTGANTNQFTVTPTTTEAYAGTFELTFTANDGINTATNANSFTLQFTTINSKYTSLLATATGTSDNNNITDSSTNNHSITVSGDVHAGTFSPYRSGGYSTYFDGTGDYIEHQGTFTLPAGTNANWTIECWVNLDQVNLNQGILRVSSTAAAGNNDDIYFSEQSGYINVACKAGGINSATSNYAMTANVWHHIAMVKNNGTIYLYNNGVYCGSVSDSNDYSGSYYIYGGLYYSTSYCFAGYLADFKISNTAIYTSGTSNFSVPTERLSSDSLTLFLTCHLPYIADGSTNAHSITVNGNTATKPFSPYDYNEYSATDHGGSMNFDGAGDALRIADNSNIQLGTSAFTIEGWFYCNDTTPTQGIVAKRDGSGKYWRWIITGGNLNFRFQSAGGGSFTFNTIPVPANTWCHFAVTRDSNNDVRQFINGISTQNAINSTGNFDISGSTLRVGEYELNTGHFDGFVSDIKIVKNSALYTSDFTPPTAPLSSSGATIHIKGTDASIIDKSQGYNLTLVGNTTGSTTQAKFTDTKSMYFDGTTDYITIPASSNFDVSLSDTTIEGWFYTTSTSVKQCLWEFYSNDNNYVRLFFEGGDGNRLWLSSTSSGTERVSVRSSATLSINTWYHIAVTRTHSSGAWATYINGSVDSGASGTESASVSTATWPFEIGRDQVATDRYWTGYIQDFRITKGLARYTANFTPPTAPLEG